jgi:hypothetical protein
LAIAIPAVPAAADAGRGSAKESIPHEHHVKHNMILFGRDEVFVSHLVYKEPHNYQVIVKVKFDPKSLQIYLDTQARHPKDLFIYLLDPGHIASIESESSLSGTILHVKNGKRIPIAEGVKLQRPDFEVIFFDELPLSLAKEKPI